MPEPPRPASTSGASSAVAVTVQAGGGRSDPLRVRMPEFDGPIGLLLALIEARRLDVLTVPLGSIAEAYLDALAQLEEDRIGVISLFVSVASQLILIKSRALLPRPPALPVPEGEGEHDPEDDLRRRLILYRAYRDAGRRLLARADDGHRSFHHEVTLRAVQAREASPAPDLAASLLIEALARVVRVTPPPPMPPEVVPRMITLADRAALIRTALRGSPVVVLQDLLRGVRDRVVVAVTFLAMLELVKRREVVVDQEEPWGPITVRSLAPRGPGNSRGPSS